MSAGTPAGAGYSGKPLREKLGIRAGFRVCIENPPDQYLELLGPLPKGVVMVEAQGADLDLMHLFVGSRQQLVETFPRAKRRIRPDGMLWISWPKRGSGLKSDLTEDILREVGLAHGLVDVKVAAIDQDWSGLKFVYRTKDRPSGASTPA